MKPQTRQHLKVLSENLTRLEAETRREVPLTEKQLESWRIRLHQDILRIAMMLQYEEEPSTVIRERP